MLLENGRVRAAAKSGGIPLWRIADELGISEPTMTRWLRVPLSTEKEEQMLAVIKRLSKAVG